MKNKLDRTKSGYTVGIKATHIQTHITHNAYVDLNINAK